MKNRILLVALILLSGKLVHGQCQIIANELVFQIDLESNQIIFDLSCDPCSFADGGINCRCRENCTNEDFEDCYTECRNEPYPIDEYYCQLDCNSYFGYEDWEDYISCFDNCGPEEERIKNITSSAYAFNLWWTHGIFEPQTGTPNESFVSQFSSGQINKITHDSTEDFMNESISYCYQYQVVITYDDGTCCDYRGSGCFQKG
jgi:hypothetical protein